MADKIEIRNAKITDVWIGKEDHGIMTCYLMLYYGGSGQGFGGYALDTWSEQLKRRIGTAYGMEWLMQLIDTLEVDRVDRLKGMCIRVEADRGKVYRVGHFMKDKWFDPAQVLKGQP